MPGECRRAPRSRGFSLLSGTPKRPSPLVERRSAVLPAAGTAALACSRRLGVLITEAYPSVAAAFTSLREPSHGI